MNSLPKLLTLVTTAFVFGGSPFLTSIASAQVDKPQPVMFNMISIEGSVKEIYYDLGKKSIRVAAGPTAMSPTYKAPESGSVTFYRLAPPVPPETEPVKVPIATVSLGDKGPYLLLLSKKSRDELGVLVLDNSWDNNPLLSSRVINASKRKTAVKVESSMAEIAPGEIHVFPPPDTPSDVLELKIATLDANQWNLRILSPQALFPFTRNTFIIKEQIPSLECPHPDSLDVFTIIDATQPPLVKN